MRQTLTTNLHRRLHSKSNKLYRLYSKINVIIIIKIIINIITIIIIIIITNNTNKVTPIFTKTSVQFMSISFLVLANLLKEHCRYTQYTFDNAMSIGSSWINEITSVSALLFNRS